jgi:glyoxylase-like metal-dependent hydrolase (beta-lactamase superfamily II)
VATDTYNVYALRYAWRDAKRGDHFLEGDPNPDLPMPMDYFVWVATNSDRTVVVDTGFKADVAARRGRVHLRLPAEALKLLDIDAAEVEDVVLTHMHYDHIGTMDMFPRARKHLQEKELQFALGRPMTNDRTRTSFEVEDAKHMVEALYGGQLQLHEGDAGPWPGISLHHLGGHTPGLQVVRVKTDRGWVVLASDSSHYYENMETDRPFRTTFDANDVRAGFRTLRELADSPAHIVPGHDPLVMQRYPAASEKLAGVVIDLGKMPNA